MSDVHQLSCDTRFIVTPTFFKNYLKIVIPVITENLTAEYAKIIDITIKEHTTPGQVLNFLNGVERILDYFSP